MLLEKQVSMIENKLFSSMSEKEQRAWLKEFQLWTGRTLPRLENPSCSWAKKDREAMERGLWLISSFLFCRSFVYDASSFGEYARQIKPMRRYVDKVQEELKKYISIQTIDLTDPSLLKPHVGRPTKAEAAARKLKAEQERKEREKIQPQLFSEDNSFSESPRLEVVIPPRMPNAGTRLHLDQLKWLLSSALQDAVDSIRDLRSLAASNAEQAKALALAGGSPKDISQYAKAAAHYTEEYGKIYDKVDNELAKVYVRLGDDTRYQKQMKKQRVDIKGLRHLLRFYYNKMPDGFREQVNREIEYNDPKQAKQRAKEEDKHKAALKLMKYIVRTDKPNTPVRIRGLEKRLKELTKLIGKEKAKRYQPYIDYAKSHPGEIPGEALKGFKKKG